MTDERNLRQSGDAFYSYSPALSHSRARTPTIFSDPRGIDLPSLQQPTFILSQDGFSPPEPGRKRRRYTAEERAQVAAKRKEKACEEHRASKTKCTCVQSNSTASSFQRYLDEGERHEKIALGLTSSMEHMKELERAMERSMAQMDNPSTPKSPKPKAQSKRQSYNHSNNQRTAPPSNRGTYSSFKISSPSGPPNTIRPSPTLAPKGLMSPPMTRRPAPTAQNMKSPSVGSVPMARGDSGYSYYSVDSVPTLVDSAGPPSTQVSPPQNPMLYTPTSFPIPSDWKGQLLSGELSGFDRAPSSSHPVPNDRGFKNPAGTDVADPVLFDDPGDFDYTSFLNFD